MTNNLTKTQLVAILIIGVALLILANLWVEQGALITLAAQVAMAVPPVPALLALLVMLVALPLLRRFGVDRKFILAVYCFLTLSVALTSGAAMRFFLPALTTLFYFATPENNLTAVQELIPDWLVPQGQQVVQQYFEGAPTGAVPWDAWLGPLSIWLLFFTALFGLFICIVLILQPVWEDGEHLVYPVAEVPLMLAGYREDTKNIWKDSLFWLGFGLVCVHQLLNILNAFNPAVVALGLKTNLGPLFQEAPWNAIQPLHFDYNPAVLGIGYLMPTELALTTVVFYFGFYKALGVGGAAAGINLPGWPFRDEIASGAFLCLAIILIYSARARIAAVFSRIWGANEGSRLLPIATLVCAATIFAIWYIAGMSPIIILLFYGLMILFALTVTRMRAAAGYPSNWARPLEQERDLLVNFLGVKRLVRMSDMRSMALMNTTYFMARGYTPGLMAFIADSFKIGTEAKITRKHMTLLMVAAVVLGSIAAWWMHLGAFYQFGANVLEGGTTSGGQRVTLMRQAYETVATWVDNPAPPNPTRAWAAMAGFSMVAIVALIRRGFLRFPFHPLGVVMSLTGAGENSWGPLLLIVLIKSVSLHVGGMRLYRRLIPLFIGIAIGHYFAAGTVWALIASFGGEGFNKYPVWF